MLKTEELLGYGHGIVTIVVIMVLLFVDRLLCVYVRRMGFGFFSVIL